MSSAMETRFNKEIVPGPAFVEVTVKEELQDVLDESDECYLSEASKPKRKQQPKTTSNTNTHKSPGVQPKPTVCKRSRYTQVIAEDIDLAFFKESDRIEMLGKAEPIETTVGEDIVPQCRICLRRVARENLHIILTQHKKKARVAFQLRVFPHDVYPFICINCQNLLDMFFDFKNAMIKAKHLLVCKQAYMESEGWDDQEHVDFFTKCKQAVAHHRQQIDSLYEEQIKSQKTEYEEYLDDNDSGAENEDDNDHAPLIKPECVIREDEVSSLNMDNTVPIEDTVHDVVPTNISNPIPKFELVEPPSDDSMDEDYRVNDEDDADEEYVEEVEKELKKPKISVKIKKEKKEKKVKVKKEKQPVKIKKEKKVKDTKEKKSYPVVRQLCDLCGEYIRPESVESHRNKHLGIKPYVCSVENCEAVFSCRYNLTNHIKRFHKPGGVGAHPCNICGKVIQGSIAVLKYHQRRHNIDQKSHICQVCGKEFTMKWYLTQHSVIHTGEFPHKCKYCGKRFNNKWSMKTHEKNIHEKKNQVSIEPQVEEHQPWNPINFPGIPPQIASQIAPQIAQHIAPQIASHIAPQIASHIAPQNASPISPQHVYSRISDENSAQ